MLKNIIKIAFRNILRYKANSFINICGLAIGIASCLIISLWVWSELNYDNFHNNSPNIYRSMSDSKYWEAFFGSPAPLAPAIASEVPGIVDYTRLAEHPRRVFRYEDKAFYEEGGFIVDPAFFKIFTFPFKAGNPENPFTSPCDVVISAAMAQKYFGDVDPIGQNMQIDGNTATVTGVIADVPANSHLQFDYLSSFEYIRDLTCWGTSWGSFNFATYVLVQDNADIAGLGNKITETAVANNCPQAVGGNAKFYLQPLEEIHLDGRFPFSYGKITDSVYLAIFSSIAVAILIIAIINFMNLSTARSASRSKEIGMRKTIGAKRFDLIMQFLGESVIITGIASVFALGLIELMLPIFNRYFDIKLSVEYTNINIIISLSIFVLLTGILAGSYPAFFLSGFSPMSAIKSSFSSSNKVSGIGRKGNLRKALVVFQFVISIALIIGTTSMYRQLHFMKNKKLGFDKENIVYVPIKERIGSQYDAFKSELMHYPGVKGVSAQDYLCATMNNRTTDYGWEGKDLERSVDMLVSRVDYNFIDLLNLPLTDGRNFSREYLTDADQAFILNERAIEVMGIESPIGKQFSYGSKKGFIVGVVKNSYLRSLHHEIEPHVLHVMSDIASETEYGVILIKVNGSDVSHTLAAIEDVWNKFNPSSPFEFSFLDETYDRLYKNEEKINSLTYYFAILAVFISCLGLFGLVSYTIERRTKEIGIRKVLGASVSSIIRLVSKEYIVLVMVSCLIASPIAWYVIMKWLQNYAYRIDLGIEIFVIAGLSAMLIAFITVGSQAVKAASADPVKSLRYE